MSKKVWYLGSEKLAPIQKGLAQNGAWNLAPIIDPYQPKGIGAKRAPIALGIGRPSVPFG
jgi:hypothetical protein